RDHAELTGMVEGDVDRTIAALRRAGDAPASAGGDGTEALVDRPHDVAGDERLPSLIRMDAVDPLGITPARSGRHDEDRRLGSSRADERVFRDPHVPDREKDAR